MSHDLWTGVDRYLSDLMIAPDRALDAALAASAQAGLPSIHVAPNQGKLLHLLARACGARKVLEIGTLGGYSTIWLARALPPGGRLVTLEIDPQHAEVARDNLVRAGVADLVEIRVGAAHETLPALVASDRGRFDLVFIDADKPSYADYWSWALELAHPGTLVIADNVVRKGSVIDPDTADPNVQGVRRFLERVAGEPRVEATTIQTVGVKGYDGFTLALVVAETSTGAAGGQ